ncbi:MAG TPA: hypothetical protein RMH99_33125, partial [Sandaracinaceae bacterium LLY-WYZ-13_1]|nr:hypothetical protein [Sandaracinaceae bacterium LLY-WYZ-13_1]
MRPAFVSALVLVLAAALGCPARARAQEGGEGVRVLFVAGGSVPGRLRARVSRLLASRAELADYAAYQRDCVRRGVRPSSRRAIRVIGPEQNVDVIVVASYGGHYRRRVLRLRYYDGESGELVESTNHTLRGMHLRATSQHAILDDLSSATGGRTSGADGEDEGEAPQAAA